MFKYKRFLTACLSALLGSIVIISCGIDCRLVECVQPVPEILFRYISKSGEDLLTGSGKKYNLEDIRLFSVNDSGMEINDELILAPSVQNEKGYVSAIMLDTSALKFLEVRGKVTDTLLLRFLTHDASKCCEKSVSFASITLNGYDVSNQYIINIVER